MSTDFNPCTPYSRGKLPSGAVLPGGPRDSRRRSDRTLKRARVLDDDQIQRVLELIERTSNSPRSDELKFLLSVYAGLRAAEIAGLTVDAMLDADGKIGRSIVVAAKIAKGGRARTIPMHPAIREALTRFRAAHPDVPFVSFSMRRAVRRQKVGAVKQWFCLTYQKAGLPGASSHSGRRTFITRLARSANHHGQSLRDVQLLAGHSRLDTTEAYIEPTHNSHSLVASLGSAPLRRAA